MALAVGTVACAGATTTEAARPADSGGSCRPAELQALFRGFQVAGDSLAGALVVVDAGSRPCRLDGSPRSVRLLDDDGDAVTARERALDLPVNGGPVDLAPGAPLPTFGAPPVHGSAWAAVTWSNWCSDASPAIRSVLLVLPGGGSVVAPLDPALPDWAIGPPTPQCADRRAGSSLSFGRFQPAA
jgi:Domain of unknown function (DUF4232)